MRAIIVPDYGSAEVLTFTADHPAPTPNDNEVLLNVGYAGVNYIDTYVREGIYPHPLPLVPGFEGIGTVAHDPRGEIAEGTVVAWCDALGSYAEQVVCDRDRLVYVPDTIDSVQAAGMLLKGMTAHYLTHDIGQLEPGKTCVLTAGAGGVGLLATQMAKKLGSTITTVVSTEEKAALSAEAGADHVVFYGENLVDEILKVNDGQVDVVFDGVGKNTFLDLLTVIKPRGTMCLFGAASGPVEPFDPQLLNKHGSLFLTRPTLAHYTATKDDFVRRAHAVATAISDGELSIATSAVVPLEDARVAHEMLQQRHTHGQVVLAVNPDILPPARNAVDK